MHGIDYYYYFILQYSPIIPLVYALIHYRKLDNPMKIILLWLSLSLLLTIVMTVMAKMHTHNLWLMNLGLPVYALLILRAFSFWEPNPKLRLMLLMLFTVFAVVWTIEIVIGDAWDSYSTFTRPLLSVVFVIVSCLAIYEGNNEPDILLTDQPKFWISAGLMIYYCGTTIMNLTSNALLHVSNEMMRSVLLIQPVLSLASHILYTVGFQRQCRP